MPILPPKGTFDPVTKFISIFTKKIAPSRIEQLLTSLEMARVSELNPSINTDRLFNSLSFSFKISDALTKELITISVSLNSVMLIQPSPFFEDAWMNRFDQWEESVKKEIDRQLQILQNDWDKSLRERLISDRTLTKLFP